MSLKVLYKTNKENMFHESGHNMYGSNLNNVTTVPQKQNQCIRYITDISYEKWQLTSVAFYIYVYI